MGGEVPHLLEWFLGPPGPRDEDHLVLGVLLKSPNPYLGTTWDDEDISEAGAGFGVRPAVGSAVQLSKVGG